MILSIVQKDPGAGSKNAWCRYKDTPVFTAHSKDARQQKLAQGKAKRDAEKALLKLAARSQPKPEDKQGNESRRHGSNPFLAPPEKQALYALAILPKYPLHLQIHLSMVNRYFGKGLDLAF